MKSLRAAVPVWAAALLTLAIITPAGWFVWRAEAQLAAMKARVDTLEKWSNDIAGNREIPVCEVELEYGPSFTNEIAPIGCVSAKAVRRYLANPGCYEAKNSFPGQQDLNCRQAPMGPRPH